MKPTALTIAGSDPSGGAGLQADLKTFHQFGVYGMSAVTLLTVQNTLGVESVDPLEAEYVARQLAAVDADIPPRAAKTGALGTAEIIAVAARWAAAAKAPLVVDPVMVSKHGAVLLDESAREALRRLLLPRAALVTPNRDEAEALSGEPVADLVSMERAARAVLALGPAAVLIKGGHVEIGDEAVDLLLTRSGERLELRAPRVRTRHTHGSGCVYSAAITAGLALGRDLFSAVETAKRFVSAAIATAPGLGRGAGPLNHHAPIS